MSSKDFVIPKSVHFTAQLEFLKETVVKKMFRTNNWHNPHLGTQGFVNSCFSTLTTRVCHVRSLLKYS